MKKISIQISNSNIILALGAESAGNFSVYHNGEIYHSENFGDLLAEKKFNEFQEAVLSFLKKRNLKPEIILTDLHPEMRTTLWGKELATKFNAKHIQIQHHHAHIFSQILETEILKGKEIGDTYGIALDGTGYGLDGKIWGGEIFYLRNTNQELQIERIGHLENQIMIGGDLAIREPARMLISILSKINFNKPNKKPPQPQLNITILCNMVILDKNNLGKNLAYHFVKKYYSKNQFELLYNQLQQNFNCQKTSGAGRILDAVSVLLDFAKNERKYKHQATDLLKKNSTKPYSDLKPKIRKIRISNRGRTSPVVSEIVRKLTFSSTPPRGTTSLAITYKLSTTHLFEYLIKNFHRDKQRLAATAQLYIAQGVHEIIKRHKTRSIKHRTHIVGHGAQSMGHGTYNIEHKTCNAERGTFRTKMIKQDANYKMPKIILSGGISDNEIILNYFKSKNILINKNSPIPFGDAGLSIGQIAFYLLQNKHI